MREDVLEEAMRLPTDDRIQAARPMIALNLITLLILDCIAAWNALLYVVCVVCGHCGVGGNENKNEIEVGSLAKPKLHNWLLGHKLPN